MIVCGHAAPHLFQFGNAFFDDAVGADASFFLCLFK